MTTEQPAVSVSGDDLTEFLVYLAEQGFADEVGSRVTASVTNKPTTGTQLRSVLDEGDLEEAAAASGLSVDEYTAGMARTLPGLVDTVTPQGELTDDEDDYEAAFEAFFDSLEEELTA
ncbi:hypothetical protein G3I40_20720 [Streptomyces sp. SID14478]|uniref:YidB family protein n=1 Tax=Streptomyces sp. SID14478 TaxID=2706073 RepID=UPI0013D94365|nr:YidB family protein [Streptomyces sp. SID14478]NEB77617.1 hypothetical protein [Streptomyces sp. SID14478]